jgi:hypothetical protein
MTKKVTLTLSILSTLLFAEVSAQNVYFSGLGRALVTYEKLQDKTDEASKLKASGGYTLFDLGIYAKPNEVLRGGVILRTRNEFGGFFGDGASLSFRQMQLEGLIAKKVKYDIGDIYLTHTPYTLWNNDAINGYNKYEANVFSVRRDIVNYENFFVGNAWRMQGVNASGKINFSKVMESLVIRGYAGRTRQTDFLSTPDRYFYGGRLDLTQSKFFRIAGNVAGVSDIPGTVKESDVNYNNMVYTSDFAFTLDKSEKFKFVLNGEAGISHFELARAIDSTKKVYDDYFYDVGAKATYKPLNFNLGVSYRDVGFNFSSPMAQTRRIGQPAGVTPTYFPTMNDGVTARPITLYDPYVQETKLYNQSISTTLMNYYVQYDMVEPYGKATPNRRGFTVTGDIQDPKEIIKAGVEANLLSEVTSEGDSLTSAKRKFTKITGGFVLNINKLIGFEKLIAINAGIRTESSVRTGTNPLNLASTLFDLGLDVEVLKDLHLLGGAKMFAANGTEIQTGRDQWNQINSFGPGISYNQTQKIWVSGLRYDYDKSGYFSMQYHIVDSDDKITPLNSFNLNQWFFVFGLKF